jgi:type II secretory pathway pseudopilin PulG
MKISLSLPRSGRQAFTLVEVLVSSALTIIVLMMLFAVLLSAMDVWQGGTTRLQTNADARLALDLVVRDLQSMVVRQTQYDQQWLSSVRIPVAGAPSGISTTWLTFFAPSLDRDPGQEGDIVALSYAAGLQDPFTASNFVPVYGLYKSMIDTTNTFANALGKTDILGGFWNIQPPATQPLNRRGVIIPNVVDFKVTWWVRDVVSNAGPFPILPTRPLRLGNQLYIDNVVRPTLKIEAADISLTILTDEGMREARLGNTADLARLQGIIRKHGRTHTQRVVIQY